MFVRDVTVLHKLNYAYVDWVRANFVLFDSFFTLRSDFYGFRLLPRPNYRHFLQAVSWSMLYHLVIFFQIDLFCLDIILALCSKMLTHFALTVFLQMDCLYLDRSLAILSKQISIHWHGIVISF